MEEKERENGKSIQELKSAVLFAYLARKTNGVSIDARRKWEAKYEVARSELEQRIALDRIVNSKKDPSR